jgi:tRNA A-37 threonylcarbamoyl transferase component Bud32
MEKITYDEYTQLITDTKIIEKDDFGLKVLESNNGKIIKLFRRKQFISTALVKPYALRFINNAQRLTDIGIPTVTIDKLLWCRDIKRHIVIYQKLAGKLLRDAFFDPANNHHEIAEKFGAFIATLHQKGVLFRSAHLKNILLLPDGEFGLIDISDMQIKRKPLTLKQRLRNFEHILRYQEDKNIFKAHLLAFNSGYFKSGQVKNQDSKLINEHISSLDRA